MGFDYLRFSNPDFQVNEEFLKRLEDIQHSLFDSPILSPGFARELKYGFGNAFGHRLVDWVWESLEPSFKSSSPSLSSPDLWIQAPESRREFLQKAYKEASSRILKATGVRAPDVVFKEGRTGKFYYRSRKLCPLGPKDTHQEVTNLFESLLKDRVWRLLSVEQVKRQMHGVFSQKPEVAAAFHEEGIGTTKVWTVLKDLLRDGYPILEFDLIIETILEQRDRDGAPTLGDRVILALSELKGTRFLDHISQPAAPPDTQDDLEEMARADEVTFEFGRGLLSLVDPRDDGADLMERMRSLRRSFATKYGWVPPGIRLSDDLSLDPDEIRIRIRGREVLRAPVWANLLMAMAPSDNLKSLRGVHAHDPTFGNPVVWLDPDERDKAEKVGCLIFSPASAISTALTQTLIRHAGSLFTHESLRDSLDNLQKEYRTVVDLIDDDPGLFLKTKRLFCALLDEQLPVTDKLTILEVVLDHQEKQVKDLVELVRQRFSDEICANLLKNDDELHVIEVAPELQDELRGCLRKSTLELGEGFEERLSREILLKCGHFSEHGLPHVLLVDQDLRRPFWEFCRLYNPDVVVVCPEEIPHTVALVISEEVKLRERRPKVRPQPAAERAFHRARKWRRRPIS